jgi:hypothetical protein
MKNDAAISAVFGARIYHEWVPQSLATWPALVFQQVTGNEFAIDFDSLGEENLELVSYQFDVYARSSADVISASQIFVSQMRKLRGTIGSVTVQHSELVNTSQLGEIVGDKQVRRVSSDFLIYYVPSGV